ncbi:hypothetical protein EMIHUDRAFT_196742 [Emiliania huxleyi CCMP1516]|uniref:Phosphatidic acid phosphatase type 2/haloperoxidase domain-containing protein n=4 Tax=Emiliania huxleyi TaxID=2903 RepID=A0A0D3J4M6_EMIH1|nr:hypothetical protein EMIHUDRAFT_196742 [Emiliania huxleyi CCMP1516]EOD18461.1 hypothetical protein EMIHUDRAFT_196742 [Emiliania huxleyi CCMP1516]|eukprot:XP_005770890.1 hypothetical protein EMIHUDRAFT_196742 [Emiliania huxleyi CCMP1516]
MASMGDASGPMPAIQDMRAPRGVASSGPLLMPRGYAQPSLSRFPIDGSALDRLDKWLSRPAFRLRLGHFPELVFSVPACCFGYPLAAAPLALWLALLAGGSPSPTAWALAAAATAAVLGLHLRLLLTHDAAAPAATAARAARSVYSVPAILLTPPAAVAAAHVLGLPGRGAAHAYLTLWYASIAPVLMAKRLARRRRPIASADVPPKALPAIRAILEHDANASFPSGDAAGAMSFAYPALRCAGLPAAAIGCLLLACFGRLYYGAHHLLDVAAGALLALLTSAAAELLLLPAGLCAAAWWHPLVAQACVLATVKALRLDAKLARTAAADR